MTAVRAQELGYENVFVMPEGTLGWESMGLPTVRGGKAPGDGTGDRTAEPGGGSAGDGASST